MQLSTGIKSNCILCIEESKITASFGVSEYIHKTKPAIVVHKKVDIFQSLYLTINYFGLVNKWLIALSRDKLKG